MTTYDRMCEREIRLSNTVHIKETEARQAVQFAYIGRTGVTMIRAALQHFGRELSLWKDIEAMQRSARMIGALDEQEPPRPDPPHQRPRAGKPRVKPEQPSTGADDQTG